MASLRRVVGSILVSLTRAQHLANLESHRLSGLYRADRLLRGFSVPNAVLNEVDIVLKYGVADTPEWPLPGPAAPEPDPPAELFLRHARRVADRALSEARGRLGASEPGGDAEARGRHDRVLESLAGERTRGRLAQALSAALERAWHAGAGSREEMLDSLRTAAEEVLDELLWSDSELPQAARPASAAAAQPPRWMPVLERLASWAGAVAAVERVPDLEVFVDAERLGETRPAAVQKLKLRVGMRGYHWVVRGDGSEELVPDG